MHLRPIYGTSPYVKPPYKLLRLSLLIASPFVLLGAVMTQIDPFQHSAFRRFSVQRTSVIETVPCDGQIWYHHVAYLKPPIPGRVDKLLVKVGEPVHKGQTLMYMTSDEGAELLDVARAKHSPDLKEIRHVFQSVPIITYFSGFLIEVHISQNESFTTSDDLFVVADELMANVQVAETTMPKIHIGQKATVVINAMPDRKVTAEIKEIPLEGYEPSDGVVLYTLVLKPDSLPADARIGMSTQAFIEVDRRDNVLAVPSKSVRFENGQPFALVSGFGWTTERRPVQLGLDNGEMVEVKAGLAPGDVVLVPRAGPGGSGPDLEKDLLDTMGGDPVLAERMEHVEKPDVTANTKSSTDKKSTSKNASGHPTFHGARSRG